MSRFAGTLQEISDRLTIPQPARSRMLLEIAADMEDLYVLHRKRGLSDEEARRRAVESCELSDESLNALASVHAGPVRRLLDALPAQTLSQWERTLLIVLVLLAALLAIGFARGGRVFADAGPFLWPVLLIALASLGLALRKVYQLYLKQDHDRRRLRQGLDSLLTLAGIQVFLGFIGGWVEALMHSSQPDATPEAVMTTMFAWALHATALLQVALALALLGALSWFILAGKTGRIERDEAALLLETGGAGVSSTGSGPDPKHER